MRARLLWTLLLLGAVFAMQGLSCYTADCDMTGASPSASSIIAADTGSTIGSMVEAVAADAAMPGMDADAGTDQRDGHGVTAHALMVCLAVLVGGVVAGLAALAARMARRRLLTICARSTRCVQIAVGRAVACAPVPELSRLCVLRV
ncbi:hypothetical protein [Klenkia terrae]|uniref:Uncharacterized protein n=1 Tax=Klenkia terrae TaxID=1052259 RepID=A0ABU8E5J8_9ACTN